MAVDFICSNVECRRELSVGDELSGKKVKCPKCKTVMVVPKPRSATDASDSTGFEATMVEANEQMSEVANAQVSRTADDQASKGAKEQSGKQTKEGGVEALDTFLDGKRGKFEPFDRERELAHGGMGAVILAKDKAIQRELAVKVMRPQIADSEEHRLRFLEEAQVTGQLEHPNIVPIHELGKDAEGNLYFTMKLVKGRSLGGILEGQRSEARDQRSDEDKRPASGVEHPESSTQHPGERSSPKPNSVRPVSLPDLLNIFLKVCDGMAFAHSRGVIHRDLKPGNIMVGEFGEVQIMDWGLAKVREQKSATEGSPAGKVRGQQAGEGEPGRAGSQPASGERPGVAGVDTRPKEAPGGQASEDAIREAKTEPAGSRRAQDSVRSVRSDSDVALTMEGTVSGTPAYMPPEQAEGKIELIDHRSDIYSLGAILYEILTLERPVEGQTAYEVLLNVSDGKIVPPEARAPDRQIPKELSAVAMKAMAKNRRRRYQSVPELAQDIRLFLEGRAVSAKQDTFAESVAKLVKRNKGVSSSIGVAALVVLMVTSYFVVNLRRERDAAVRHQMAAQKARDALHENALRSSKALAEQAVRAAEGGRWAEAEFRAKAAQDVSPPNGPWGAYAHGVLHKIMVGEFGEVQIMDWGLAKVLGQDHRPDERSSSNATLRRTGTGNKDAK